MDTFLVQPVHYGFHRDIAGQVPVTGVAPAPGVQMAEQAVKHHVKVNAIYINPAAAVQLKQRVRIISDHETVRPQRGHGRVRLVAQAAERQIQKTHIHIEFVPSGRENADTQFDRLQFLHLTVSDRIGHSCSFLPESRL